MSIPVELAHATSSTRFVWFDGQGFDRPWSGLGGTLGVLGEDDVSLTFGAARREVWRHRGGSSELVGDDIFDVLEGEVARDAGGAGRSSDPPVLWAGYLGYACRTDLPARPTDLAAAPEDTDRVPDAVWLRIPTSSLHPLHLSNRPSCRVEPPLMQGSTAPHAGMVRYEAAFEEVQRQLRLGNSYEVNLTYRESLTSTTDPLAAYLRLRELNPAPYTGYLRHRGVHLLSSSPERYAAVDAHRTLEARPIKGTTPRGATEAEDEEHRRRLSTDPRYRAENLMIVDLLRNDLSMVCDPGTVVVPGLMEVESYPSVHQLVSTVRGHLADGVSTVAALRALFPAGSMTGAPKRRTMEIIEAVETSPRGVYAGAFGWISPDGRADLSVVIRSLVAGPAPSRGAAPWVYELGTGGGITVRSTAEEEYAETRWKAARLRAALRSDT